MPARKNLSDLVSWIFHAQFANEMLIIQEKIHEILIMGAPIILI